MVVNSAASSSSASSCSSPRTQTIPRPTAKPVSSTGCSLSNSSWLTRCCFFSVLRFWTSSSLPSCSTFAAASSPSYSCSLVFSLLLFLRLLDAFSLCGAASSFVPLESLSSIASLSSGTGVLTTHRAFAFAFAPLFLLVLSSLASSSALAPTEAFPFFPLPFALPPAAGDDADSSPEEPFSSASSEDESSADFRPLRPFLSFFFPSLPANLAAASTAARSALAAAFAAAAAAALRPPSFPFRPLPFGTTGSFSSSSSSLLDSAEENSAAASELSWSYALLRPLPRAFLSARLSAFPALPLPLSEPFSTPLPLPRLAG
mmetsp:Transcript_55984/g.88709  ORF Transcript_55984/g.88709 Transcript_55984/m.88709 type:complete len:317 (+) Transcript_55984:1557-2507(+)